MLDINIINDLTDKDYEILSTLIVLREKANDYSTAVRCMYHFPISVFSYTLKDTKHVKETINFDHQWFYEKDGTVKASINLNAKNIYEKLKNEYLSSIGFDLEKKRDDDIFTVFKSFLDDTLKDYNDRLKENGLDELYD